MCIFKNYKTKTSIKFPNYNKDKLIFSDFLFENDDKKNEKLRNPCKKVQKIDKAKRKQFFQIELTITCINGQKIKSIEKMSNKSNAYIDQKIHNTKTKFYVNQKSTNVIYNLFYTNKIRSINQIEN